MITRVFIFVCLILSSTTTLALDTRSIPEPLKAWIPWVLDGVESINCPFEYRDFKQHYCAWPDTLTLDVDKKGAQFNQHWTVFEESWIPLPGNEQHWPQGVIVEGKPQPVIAREGKPRLHLEKGKYRIEGRFDWQVMPESILLPQTVGLVRLVVNDKYIEFPRIEQNGKLWLNEQLATQLGEEEDRLGVEVFRQVVDDMPLQLVTRLELKVVGKAREITLGKVIPDHFIPLSLRGPLPMRLESDGMLKLQVRPGNWTIELVARYPGETTTLSLPQSNLPDTELWAFQAQPSLRLAEIEGVDAVDPRQTRIPGDWQNLPVYRMDKSRSFLINVKRRGDPDPSPNELQLERTLWLDFDGNGYTFRDKVSGQMHRGWRLNMDSRLPLGRVVINGVDQLVTRYGDNSNQGVEVRHGRIDLFADGRIEESIRTVPAIGWNENFQRVQTNLNLPPGWRLFSVSGADSTSNATWIEKWTLLDIFLVLIGALAINRLLGSKWAAIALVTFVLTWHESAAPQYIWLAVIAALGLVKVAPPGQLRRVSVIFRYATLLALIVIVLPYVVDTVRTAIYPQLEKTHSVYPASIPVMKEERLAGRTEVEEGVTDMLRSAPTKLAREKKTLFSSYSVYTDTYDPKSKVQTGPGLPEWFWSSVPVSWSGPVQQSQLLKLVLLPPWLTALLKIVSVLFVMALSLCLAGMKFQKRRVSVDLVKFGFAALLVGAGFTTLPADARADMPTPEILKELKERLLKAPECLPGCAQIARMKLRVSKDMLSMRLEVHANEDVVVPLPGRLDVWVPGRVVMDGKTLPDDRVSASGLMVSGGKVMPLLRGKENALWLSVPKGRHQIDLSGTIPPVKMLQLPLPLKPHQVTTEAKGWKVKGVHPDGNIEEALQIERVETDIKKDKTFAQTILPPFVTAKRIIRLGLDWRVDNEVTRVSPPGSAIAIEVPLLDGESVISENVHVKDGKALITFSPQDQVIRWQSILPITDALTLKAANTTDWMEVWQLDVSPVWHTEAEGLPEIHHQSSQGTRFPEWRPWPGETLSVSVSRPVGIEGQTLTIDRSELDIKPGKRATDVSLSFRVRSSQAVQHIITLPGIVTLKDVSINGQTQPIRLENNKLQLPILPGMQNIEIRWQDANGISSLLKTPAVDMGVDSVNASVKMTPPRDRWVLFAGGPRLGPAVLFWGVLVVVVLIAVGLGRTTITPLKTHHWILLGVGLTQAQLIAALIVVGWFFAMAYRQKFASKIKTEHFNAVQMVLALFTFATLASLVATLGFGLLGYPDMQITGNGSSSYVLKWFDDRINTVLPSAWFVSVSMWFYRGLMLIWSLWLAFALLGWLKWAWQSYTTEGLWRKKEVIRKAEGPGEAESKEDKWSK